ncbi:LLM class flavin-dependent oxidoreductase [Actinospongicola halichondriae]|uniref:LLM class flavin-dependent oxidoreductase n=1 Tax=Actinospongicola halichondriae TaxID=3236844 RepID=UPI003D48BB7F
MDIGMSLPTMASGYTRETTVEWCRRLDDSPFSSVSAGERMTFQNPELFTTLAAAAALTERVRVMANVVVLPWHSAGLVTKQLLTIEQLAPERLVVGVGVGGREEDYATVGVPFASRHARLDAGVAEFLRLWSGEIPDGATAPLGPRPSVESGPPLLAGALGPKAMARAAQWADGVTGFSVGGVADEMAGTFRLAEKAWGEAGRAESPRLVTGCFFALGPDAGTRLREGVHAYLRVFGDRFADAMASTVTASDPDAVRAVLDGAAAAGADEVVLVPMSTDLACLTEAAVVVAD